LKDLCFYGKYKVPAYFDIVKIDLKYGLFGI
jgi:hypothetical protein